MKKSRRALYSSKQALEYSSVPSMEASATIWPSRGGLSRAWQYFITVSRTVRFRVTIMPMRMPHSEYRLDTESMRMTFWSSPRFRAER